MYTYREIEKEVGEVLGGEGIRTVSLADKQDFDTVAEISAEDFCVRRVPRVSCASTAREDSLKISRCTAARSSITFKSRKNSRAEFL